MKREVARWRRSQALQAGDHEVDYLERTGSGPVLVLLHGNSSSPLVFESLIEHLDAEVRVFAPRLPGHGQRPEGARDREGMGTVPALKSLVEAFCAEVVGPGAVLVGHSLGGHLFAQPPAEAVASAAGVMLMGAPPLPSPAAMGEAFTPIVERLLLTPELSESEALEWVDQTTTRPERCFAVVQDLVATPGWSRPELVGSVGRGEGGDEVASLRRATVPVALVRGERDPLIGLDYLESLGGLSLWRGGVRVLDGVGHYPQLEDPEQTADLIQAFIADCGPQNGGRRADIG